jgi:hypothetical protein
MPGIHVQLWMEPSRPLGCEGLFKGTRNTCATEQYYKLVPEAAEDDLNLLVYAALSY